MSPEVKKFIETVDTYRELNIRDSERVVYTPSLAEYALSTNKENRGVQERAVQAYAADMRSGRWNYNGETVKFDVEGNMIDGQHRMLAVVLSGAAVEMLTVFGLPREVRRTVDMGKARSVADLTHMRGGMNGVKLAAIARQLILYEHGVYRESGTRRYIPTKLEVDDYMIRHEAELDDALFHVRRNFSPWNGLTTSLAAAYIIIRRRYPQRSEEIKTFFTDVIDNVGLVPDTAKHTLRRTLERMRRDQRGYERVEVVLRGWAAHNSGRTCKMIRVSQEFPKDF